MVARTHLPHACTEHSTSHLLSYVACFTWVTGSRGLCTQVEDLITKELALARELIAAKRRERALLALKKKKLREGQLEQIDAYLLNVEQASTLQSRRIFLTHLQLYRCCNSTETAPSPLASGSSHMAQGRCPMVLRVVCQVSLASEGSR